MRIVFDIGGTNMRVALVSENGVSDVKKIPTPKEPKEAIVKLAELAREAAAGQTITVAAGGIRGRVVEGVFLKDKVLDRWEGTNLVAEISKALNAPVTLVHDTALLGLGEARYRAGRGSKTC